MQTNHHVGRLTKPISLTEVGQNHLKKVSFCLAINRSSGSQDQKKTDFIYYTAFGKTAELLAKYGNQKGLILEVAFEMQSASLKKNDGSTQYFQNNVVHNFKFWSLNRTEKETPNFQEAENENENLKFDTSLPDYLQSPTSQEF